MPKYGDKCNTDSDCITTLGWEYTCADVYQYQSNWPKFDPDTGIEIANDNKSTALVNLLQQGTLPPGVNSKKCVYRGAGAPCRVDYANITDSGKRKAMACAPNFYCANIVEEFLPWEFQQKIIR